MKNCKIMHYLFLVFFFAVSHPCYAHKSLSLEGDFLYEVYEALDKVPRLVLDEGFRMYVNTYREPKLHQGIPLSDLHIAPYSSYDEFAYDLIKNDFESYLQPNLVPRLYFQVQRIQDNKVVGICVLLDLKKGNYYLDHIGVDHDFRRQAIATNLLSQAILYLGEFKEISLDTRVFNAPAQAFYEKLGFIKQVPHPCHKKEGAYFRYVLNPP